MSSPEPQPLIRTERRGRVLLAAIDMPGRSMNVFSAALMDALEALIETVERNPDVGALVLTSGKETFLAGADLEMVRGFTELGRTAGRRELRETCGRLGRLFCRLEALAKPTVAALNGLALGGGLEVAMACHARVAADHAGVQLGLPEIKLGLLPGAGGTQRLPRLVGIEKGLELLLNGRPVGAAEAQALGLVDEVVPAAALVERAVALAESRLDGPARSPMPVRLDPGPFDLAASDAVRRITRQFGYADAVTARYPAYDAIVRSVVEAADLPVAEGIEVEMQRFIDLMQDPVAGNMVTTLFIDRQRADKQLAGVAVPPGTRFAVVGDRPAAEELRAALRAARASLVPAEEAGAADIVIAPADAAGRADLRLLADAADRIADGTGIHLRRDRATGSAIEIVEAGGDPVEALILARQLRATPYRHRGDRSVLAALAAAAERARAAGADEDGTVAAVAEAAAGCAAAGSAGDPAMADVAAVVGGLFPAHAGGPFRHAAARAERDAVTARPARRASL